MEPLEMTPGLVIGDRFRIERLVRQGGLSQVFRARELTTGQTVALKVLYLDNRPREVERFLRQVESLRGLEHEGIAGYVDHGQVSQGEGEGKEERQGQAQGPFYVATRWLAGEDLARRLGRQPLTVAESLSVVRKAAEVLAAVHERGLVHGELRPSKLLLKALNEGAASSHASAQVALLNFGITAGNLATRTLTGTGEIVAALRYLAPERARGEPDMDASVDVYALGCMLFECLTGQVLFAGEHAAVVLMRILHEEVPRLRELRPELPESLERLLTRMLAKQPAARVADGRALMEALEEVDVSTAPVSPAERAASPSCHVPGALEGMSGAGWRWVCAVLAMPGGASSDRGEEETFEGVAERMGSAERLLLRHGAQVDRLAGGAMIATLPEAWGAATDQAVHAARIALVLRQHLDSWPVAVATGRGPGSGAQLMGQATQQAVELLRADMDMDMDMGREPRPVWLDELTAGLVETRFHVRKVTGESVSGWVLEQERKGVEEVRTLLGRRTPCVGRGRELEFLEMQLRACTEESVARALVVMAPPGIGKTRLMEEFLRRVHGREEGVEILIGRGDPLRAGVAHGLLGQAVLEWCGLGARGEVAGAARHEGFARRVRRLLKEGGGAAEESRGRFLAEFLGEVCGVPCPGGTGPEEPSPQLRAARQDPRLMNDRVTEAWVEFLRSMCAAHPVLLVLEDLHWSDAATVRLVDVALGALAEERFMVLGFGRPELLELFPLLWQKHPLQEMRLPPLGRRASEQLVQEMLGERAPAETVGRIVEQAGGHALFLEELILSAVEGADDRLPETLQAMIEARFVRLGRLDPGARRLLEVASVMGEAFWRGGVLQLLAAERDVAKQIEVHRSLSALLGTELIVRQGESRFPSDVQYVFRHALVRDVAYGLLSEEERRLGHRLVGCYLEGMGEQDLVVLGEHYRLGGEGQKAAGYFARAAVQAMEASDPEEALRAVSRGVGCEAAGEVLGTLRAVGAQAELWNSNFTAALAAGTAALPLLAPGSVEWYRASGPVLSLVGRRGREALFEQIRIFAEAVPQRGAEGAFAEPALLALRQIAVLGIRSLARSLLDRMQAVCDGLPEGEARARGLLELARSWYHLLLDGDPGPARGAAERAMACLAAAGDGRYQAAAQGNLGLAQALMGDGEGALASCRAAIGQLEALKEVAMLRMMQGQLAIVLTEVGGPQHQGEVLALADRVTGGGPQRPEGPQPDFWTVLGQGARATVLAGRGELVEAEAAARQALGAGAAAPVGNALASAVLSRVLLGRGAIDEARRVAEAALKGLGPMGGAGFMDVKLRLAAAEACTAAGDHGAAVKVLRAAEKQILRRAAQLPEGAARRRFEEAVPDHERARALLE